jgi:hypothetical protein
MCRKRRKVHFDVEREGDFPEGIHHLRRSTTPEAACEIDPIVAGAFSQDTSCLSENLSDEPEVCYGGVSFLFLFWHRYLQHIDARYSHSSIVFL